MPSRFHNHNRTRNLSWQQRCLLRLAYVTIWWHAGKEWPEEDQDYDYDYDYEE